MLRMRFSELCMRIIYSSVQGPTIKINKNKPGEHIKCNVKWFNVDLLQLRLTAPPRPYSRASSRLTTRHGGQKATKSARAITTL